MQLRGYLPRLRAATGQVNHEDTTRRVHRATSWAAGYDLRGEPDGHRVRPTGATQNRRVESAWREKPRVKLAKLAQIVTTAMRYRVPGTGAVPGTGTAAEVCSVSCTSRAGVLAAAEAPVVPGTVRPSSVAERRRCEAPKEREQGAANTGMNDMQCNSTILPRSRRPSFHNASLRRNAGCGRWGAGVGVRGRRYR